MSRLFVIVIVLLGSQCGYAQTNEQIKAMALKYANRYCSNAAEILQAEDAESIALYMDHQAEPLDIQRFGTAVHEALHNYDWELAGKAERATSKWDDRFKSYFVNTGIVLSTEEQSIFKTSTLHKRYFPQAVKEMSRYETYIQEWGDDVSDENSKLSIEEIRAFGVEELRPGEARTTSNVKGLYGLMEEFNAYHHGIKAEYEIITNMEGAETIGSTNSVAAYFEFNVFMAYYLKYAKEYVPEVYRLLMNDRTLRVAYTLIELSWRELITNIYAHDQATKFFMYWQGEPDLFTEELQEVMLEFMIPKSQLGEYEAYANTKRYDPDTKALVLRKIEEQGQLSFDQDVDWGKWDESSDGSYTREVTFEIEPMLPGKHYVVVAVEKDAFSLMEIMDAYRDSNVRIGMDLEDQDQYYIFIAKFSSLSAAEKHLKKHQSKFPDIEVVSP